jgi:hypothetical protein
LSLCMASNALLSDTDDGLAASHDLDSTAVGSPRDLHGKGRYVDGQETVEEDPDEGSDAEAEGLLQKSRLNKESSAEEDSGKRRLRTLGSGRTTPARTFWGRVLGDMSNGERRVLITEMLTQVRSRCSEEETYGH